jgi:glycosyltransferase involved in cell wall biosynthesis
LKKEKMLKTDIDSKNGLRKKISAIIAVYRDAPAVPIMYSRLIAVFEKIDVDYEIIFVNDCSPDNAREVLSDLARQDSRVIVINHSRNFGSQNAFTSGALISTGEAVVFLDGDLQDPPELIESFYYKWVEGFDVVYGVRVKREASLFMRFAYKSFYRLFHNISYINIPLDAGDFSLIDRRVVNVLNNLPENNRFIRGLRAWVGFKQTGISYIRPERMFGKTTNNLIKNFDWAKKAILSFSYVPLDMISWIALVTVIGAVLLALVQLALRIFLPTISPSGFTTLIILILFMGGVQLLCLAVIGSYLSHIYDEVKHRPPFIVESILNKPVEQTNRTESNQTQKKDHGS